MVNQNNVTPSSGEPAKAVKDFQFERLLNQDQAGRRICLLGTIDSKPAILLVERAVFPNDTDFFKNFVSSLSDLNLLSANDIYHWFVGNSRSINSATESPDYKLNLIYPCTDQHIKKYSQQGLRTFVETPEVYKNVVRPYMEEKRSSGRLTWIWNILDGKAEQEDILYRERGSEGFVVMPDLNWDRITTASLHLLGIVERRDIWSVRDLTKDHINWLKHMRQKLISTTTQLYPGVEKDQVKLYVHYQPTYYHFHIHIVHVNFEAGASHAVGKALGVESIISQLEVMAPGLNMADMSITYNVGEQTDLWTNVLQPYTENMIE